MNERTYHKVLSTVVHKLLHPILAVLTPHMRLYKQAQLDSAHVQETQPVRKK
jgi:hypothetical protein